ncbi:MAG: Pathogenesis-related transcriptional factor and ERF protein, partial [Bacteroidota bacterium]
MIYRINLKNTDEYALLDAKVYEELTQDTYLQELGFLRNLRLHSSGCAVFQKTRKSEDGGYTT